MHTAVQMKNRLGQRYFGRERGGEVPLLVALVAQRDNGLPCGHEATLKSISDTNRRNGLAPIDTMKCGRNWNPRGRGRPEAMKALSTDLRGKVEGIRLTIK